MKNRFRIVESTMPPTMAVPTECRPSEPAPVAKYSGSTPRMNAKLVIRIGRRRSSQASIAASMMLLPLLADLFRKLHDQDGVLGRQADQHDQSDLHVHVVRQAARRDERKRAQHGRRHGQQDDERQREALILRGQRQVHHQQTQPEDDHRLAA